MQRQGWILAILWLWGCLTLACAAQPPALELVDQYPGHLDLSQYWVSEKYDGVRGYWDGHQLWTRGGTRIQAPDWFTAGWPDVAMDGELWVGYHQFTAASSIVRSGDDDNGAWHKVHYMVFDLPDHGGDFDARVPAIRQ